MTEMDNEVVASLKSTYGESWRQGMIVHILIGLGRTLMRRSRRHNPLPVEKPAFLGRSAKEDNGAISRLQKNPLAYVRLMNEKLATELEAHLSAIRTGSTSQKARSILTDHGELIEAIGIQARMRLEGNGNDELAELIETVVGAVWEEAPLTIREDILRTIELVSFFSATIQV